MLKAPAQRCAGRGLLLIGQISSVLHKAGRCSLCRTQNEKTFLKTVLSYPVVVRIGVLLCNHRRGNEVADKIKKYAAQMTVGLLKMGLNKCCGGLQFVFEGPLNDFANTVFDVPKDTTNNKVISLCGTRYRRPTFP